LFLVWLSTDNQAPKAFILHTMLIRVGTKERAQVQL